MASKLTQATVLDRTEVYGERGGDGPVPRQPRYSTDSYHEGLRTKPQGATSFTHSRATAPISRMKGLSVKTPGDDPLRERFSMECCIHYLTAY